MELALDKIKTMVDFITTNGIKDYSIHHNQCSFSIENVSNVKSFRVFVNGDNNQITAGFYDMYGKVCNVNNFSLDNMSLCELIRHIQVEKKKADEEAMKEKMEEDCRLERKRKLTSMLVHRFFGEYKPEKDTTKQECYLFEYDGYFYECSVSLCNELTGKPYSIGVLKRRKIGDVKHLLFSGDFYENEIDMIKGMVDGFIKGR